MKRDFSYYISKNTCLVILFGILFSTGCSFKTIVHPYPEKFKDDPNSYTDNITLHKDGKLTYIPDLNKSDISEDLNYKEGALIIDDGWSIRLKKEDRFINPISNNEILVIAEAYFDDQLKEDIFEVLLRNKDNTFYGYTISGTAQNTTIIRSDSTVFQISAKEFWAPSVKKVKTEDGNEWHHYPLGGTWNYINDLNDQYLVVQGSPVKKKLGAKANYGESFTLLSNTELSDEFKSEFINVFLAYWHLANIQFYYEECDLENPSSDGCPGSIIIK